jgi:hypothetical protein
MDSIAGVDILQEDDMTHFSSISEKQVTRG